MAEDVGGEDDYEPDNEEDDARGAGAGGAEDGKRVHRLSPQGSGLSRFGDWGFRGREESGTYFSDDEGGVVRLPGVQGADGSEQDVTQPSPGLGDFSLIDFVKQELRRENEQALECFKQELQEQVMTALKSEASSILQTFSKNILGQVGCGSPSRIDPITKSHQKRARQDEERVEMGGRVAHGIMEGIKAALGQAHVERLLTSDNTAPRPKASAKDRASTACAGPRRAAQGKRNDARNRTVEKRMSSSPFLASAKPPQVDGEPPRPATRAATAVSGMQRPGTAAAYEYGEEETERPCTAVHAARVQRPSTAVVAGGGAAQVVPVGNQVDEVVDDTTNRLLSRSYELLGDEVVQRARTAVGKPRLVSTAPSAVTDAHTGAGARQRDVETVGSAFGRQKGTGQALLQGGAAPGALDKGAEARTGGRRKSPQRSFMPPVLEGTAYVGDRPATSITVGRVERNGKSVRPSTTMATGRPSSTVPHVARSTAMRKDGEPLPEKLGDDEWENEVARNVLTLYVSTVKEAADKVANDDDEISMSELLAVGGSALSSATSTSQAVKESLLQRQRAPSPPPTPCSPAPPSTSQRRRRQRDTNTAPTTRPATNATTRTTASACIDNTGTSHIHMRPGTVSKTIRTLGHSKIFVARRNGGAGLVLIPHLPPTIWFAGLGTNRAEWSSLPGVTSTLLNELQDLNDRGHFSKYLTIVEALLMAAVRSLGAEATEEGDIKVPPLLQALWRQMVVVANGFATRCIETRRYPQALTLLAKSHELCDAPEGVLGRGVLQELRAYICSTEALYYHRRGKQNAALVAAQRAIKIHTSRKTWKHVATCQLHAGVILDKLGRTAEGVRCMSQVLHMVESGVLEVGGSRTQMIALVAVCYHNMAVLYLSLRNLGEAFMCSQNARRLARLSLAYTNRWSEQMERTHAIVLGELTARYKYVEKNFATKDQEVLFGLLLTQVSES